MVALKIVRPPLCGDSAGDVPREQWAALIEERVNFCKNVLPSDCRLLLFFIEDGQKSEWMGFETRERYIRDGLRLDPEMVDLALRGIQLSDPDKPLGYEPARVLGEHERGIEGGKAGPGRGNKTGSSTTRFGRGIDYILARLDRDGHKHLSAEVRSGTMSANAAAIEAGFRKKPTPFEIVLKQIPRLTADERRKLIEILT